MSPGAAVCRAEEGELRAFVGTSGLYGEANMIRLAGAGVQVLWVCRILGTSTEVKGATDTYVAD